MSILIYISHIHYYFGLDLTQIFNFSWINLFAVLCLISEYLATKINFRVGPAFSWARVGHLSLSRNLTNISHTKKLFDVICNIRKTGFFMLISLAYTVSSEYDVDNCFFTFVVSVSKIVIEGGSRLQLWTLKYVGFSYSGSGDAVGLWKNQNHIIWN